MKTLIKGGRIINPADKTDKIADLYIIDGYVNEIGETQRALGNYDEFYEFKRECSVIQLLI